MDVEVDRNNQSYDMTEDNGRDNRNYQEAAFTTRSSFEALLSEESSQDEESVHDDDMGRNDERQDSSEQQRNDTDKTSDFPTIADGDEVILSVIWQGNHLGAAYYNIGTAELFVMDDIVDANVDFDITRTLFRQCRACYVITITGMSDKFVDVVKKLVAKDMPREDEEETSSTVDSSTRVSLKLMPKKDHDYEVCRNRVNCLKLDYEPVNASNQDRMIFLNSLLNFKARRMIHALGLLLMYLDKNWNAIALESTGQSRFVHINHVSLRDVVMVDDNTYSALHIVQPKHHPSLFKFGNVASSQEGISLFSILNRCQSRPGVQYLRKLLRHPTTDIGKLNARFDVIKFCLDPKNRSVVENLTACLKHIHRLTIVIVDRLSATQAKASDWSKLYKTISHVIYIADICANHRNEASVFAKIANSVTDEMHNLKYFIEYVVDFDMCREQNKFMVRPGVDPVLDELNHQRATLPQLLTTMGRKDMENLPTLVAGYRMLYFPDIRYVLAITDWNGSPPGDYDLPGLEFKFAINGIRYYKSAGARELDDTVGDILLKITNRQSQIMLKLLRYIGKHIRPVMTVIEYCAELDVLVSFYMTARDNNYVRPELVESQVLNIKQGRHPLQELTASFVPNDTRSELGNSLVKILTGPNASGKSIYLKQIALIVFMAHIGSYVPAESATIGIVTHIFTRIHSIESVSLNASSFLIDLRQITAAIRSSTPNSLVIIDEFGKGTSEIDGLALLSSVLTYFVNMGSNCPHVFAATHFHQIMEFVPKSSLVEMQTFEYMIDEDNSLVFLYRLITGNVTCSFAHSVAKSAGLDNAIVERALKVFESMNQGSLPPPLPEAQLDKTSERISEYLIARNGNFDLDELKLWFKRRYPPSPRSDSSI